eukprot:jgi/Bigna1/130854/aug1.12_g5562
MLANLEGAKAVLLVDGDCALCHGFTQFVAARDSRDRIRFATQQSDVGRMLLRDNDMPQDLKTIICVEIGQGGRMACYKESTAVLRTTRYLDGRSYCPFTSDADIIEGRHS